MRDSGMAGFRDCGESPCVSGRILVGTGTEVILYVCEREKGEERIRRKERG